MRHPLSALWAWLARRYRRWQQWREVVEPLIAQMDY